MLMHAVANVGRVSSGRSMGVPYERLVDAVLAGEGGAWQRLWQALDPWLSGLFRRPGFLGPISDSEDHRRNIALEVMAALQAKSHEKLVRFADARRESPDLPFLAWLSVVAKRIAIDYLRREGEYLDLRRTRGAQARGAWVNLVTLPTDSVLGNARPHVTSEVAAHAIVAYADTHLAPEPRDALERWSRGETFDEIAAALGLAAPRNAERMVRAALERLRRHFRTEGSR
jgi:DNA-directed RNA polymerase specialized sigma24 family protein